MPANMSQAMYVAIAFSLPINGRSTIYNAQFISALCLRLIQRMVKFFCLYVKNISSPGPSLNIIQNQNMV